MISPTYVTQSAKTQAEDLSTPIPFSLTRRERDHVIVCQLELAAMKLHRAPAGLEVSTASEAEFLEARRAFGRAF